VTSGLDEVDIHHPLLTDVTAFSWEGRYAELLPSFLSIQVWDGSNGDQG